MGYLNPTYNFLTDHYGDRFRLNRGDRIYYSRTAEWGTVGKVCQKWSLAAGKGFGGWSKIYFTA